MRFFFFITIFICTSGVFAMELSEVGRVYLFSRISGVITLNGAPVKNATLVRTASRNSQKVDETQTDEFGHFSFPAVTERTITKFLPQEFVASQKIVVQYLGKEYVMWTGIKRERHEFVESRGKPLIVTCELNSELSYVNIGSTFIHSLCKWDVESDPPINWDEMGVFDSEAKKNDSN